MLQVLDELVPIREHIHFLTAVSYLEDDLVSFARFRCRLQENFALGRALMLFNMLTYLTLRIKDSPRFGHYNKDYLGFTSDFGQKRLSSDQSRTGEQCSDLLGVTWVAS